MNIIITNIIRSFSTKLLQINTTEKGFSNLAKFKHSSYCNLRLVLDQMEFRSMLNQSEKCNYYPNLVWFGNIPNLFNMICDHLWLKKISNFSWKNELYWNYCDEVWSFKFRDQFCIIRWTRKKNTSTVRETSVSRPNGVTVLLAPLKLINTIALWWSEEECKVQSYNKSNNRKSRLIISGC